MELSEAYKSKGKGNFTKHWIAVDKIVSTGYVLIILTLLCVYTRIRQLSKWISGVRRQVLHFWTGSLWIKTGVQNGPCGSKLELKATV